MHYHGKHSKYERLKNQTSDLFIYLHILSVNKSPLFIPEAGADLPIRQK